jgi:uncharacterized protein (TIGR03086 family)
MATEALEQAFASTRAVLANVKPEQLDQPTPCASWDVRGLVNHIVGGTQWFATNVNEGGSSDDGSDLPDFAEGDFLASFDAGAKDAVAAFAAPGALGKMLDLPFGKFPGAAFLGLATTDTFTHGWDLAKATGQSTDLNPKLAAQLLEGAKASIPDQFRGPDGKAPFGPVAEAPASASAADQLAAFLGRKV